MDKLTSQRVNLPQALSPAEIERRALWAEQRSRMEREADRFTPLGRRKGHCTPGTGQMLWAVELVLRALGVYGRGQRNALKIETEEIEFSFAGLPPAFDGFRILHLTDFHLDMLPGLAAAIQTQVAACPADVCFITGDYRDDETGPMPSIVEPLSRIIGGVRAPDGIFSTLGNHDDLRMARALEDMGVRVLANETVALARGGERIQVTGVDDVSRFYTPAAEDALARVPQGFRIALVHSPEFAAEAARHGSDLYLAGHAHGGQICLPGGKPVFTRLMRNRAYAVGRWRLGAMTGYTSRGAGFSGRPVRFNSTGEVTLITLRRGAGG
jgi:predicted MPP superfamily phosphohydrolase